MQGFRICLLNQTLRELLKNIKHEKAKGNLKMVNRILIILSVADGFPYHVIASILDVSAGTVRLNVNNFILKGIDGLKIKKQTGRASKLTKAQKKQLSQMIAEGPEKAGYPAACWRSPMIQDLIFEHFGVLYSVNYISQLLKNMGFSYQKAKFVSDHLDEQKRKEWIEDTWPEILKLAHEKGSLILFGDETSFPQWGSLSYTWAPKGKQPTVKTSGIRKSYKVLGLIDYFTGGFYCKGHEGRLNSEIYKDFLKDVLEQTDKHVIVIQDGARYHTSKAMKAFFQNNSDRITIYQLPSYSPDYNPIEKLWKKIKQFDIHLHYFPTFEALKEKVELALEGFQIMKNEILKLFGFYRNLEVC